jgi:hypothetical protein
MQILGYAQHATILILVLAGGLALPFFTLSLPTMWVLFKVRRNQTTPIDTAIHSRIDWLTFAAQGVIANYVVYIVNVAVLQLSVLFFYTRMFGIHKPFRIACYCLAAIVGAWAIQGCLTRIFACGADIEKSVFFIDTFLPGNCGDETAMCAATAVMHVIFDVSILALPVPLIWKLKISTFNKVIITMVLSIGVL